MNETLKTDILKSVDAIFDAEIDFLAELTSHPSTRGNEQSAQNFIATELGARGYSVDRWNVDVADISHLPGFSPVIGNYDDAVNVVGSHRSREKSGRSLILNGHVSKNKRG